MDKKNVMVLGVSGMLGSIVLDVLSRDLNIKVTATLREENDKLKEKYPPVGWKILDAEKANIENISKVIDGADWIINCIGIIKPYIHDDNAQEIERAIKINSLFPYLLAKAAEKNKVKVIQIATDCVYSGEKGKYLESDSHDALDVYGKTKSLGEVYSNNVYHLRCSIIGPELKNHLSLMDWFLGQPQKSQVNGFINHQWNGVTTLHFAKLCLGIIENDFKINHLQHIMPSDIITKSDLLKCLAENFHHQDITINPVEAPKVIDRTLFTENPEVNNELWQLVGYKTPPTIEQILKELSEYMAQKER